MPGDFNISAAAQEILSSERLFKSNAADLESGPLEVEDVNVLIEGDLGPGVVIKGGQSLLIQGSIASNKQSLCRIEVGGDVVILGDVQHASIECRTLRTEQSVASARITARTGLEIAGNLNDAHLIVGEFGPEKNEIDALKEQINDEITRKNAIERQLKLDQRNMHRQFHTTQFILNFTAGNTLHHQDRRIVIDLQPFYKVVGNKTESEIDRALLEFYAKAVVGLLARANRHLMIKNLNRQSIFKSLIKTLHDLYFLTRKFDKQANRIVQLESDLQKCKDALSNRPAAAVYIQGQITAPANFHFISPVVEQVGDSTAITRETAKLVIRAGQTLEAMQTNSQGIESPLDIAPEHLKNLCLRFEAGQIVSETL